MKTVLHLKLAAALVLVVNIVLFAALVRLFNLSPMPVAKVCVLVTALVLMVATARWLLTYNESRIASVGRVLWKMAVIVTIVVATRDTRASHGGWRGMWKEAKQAYHRKLHEKRTSLDGKVKQANLQWSKWCTDANVPEAIRGQVVDVRESLRGHVLTVRMAPGQVYSQLKNVAPMIASAAHLAPRPDSLVVAAGNEYRIAMVYVNRRAQEPIKTGPHPELANPVTTIKTPLPWMKTPDGHLLTIELFQAGYGAKMALIGGTKGAGKSGLFHAIAIRAIRCTDAVLCCIDLKNGVELGVYKKAALWCVTDPQDVDEKLKWLHEEYKRRSDILKQTNARVIDPSRDMPVIILLVDELAQMNKNQQKELQKIIALGRFVGIGVWVATQRPTATLVDTNLRALVDDYIVALRVQRIDETAIILGHRYVDSSAIPAGKDWAGTGYVDGIGDDTAFGRGFYFNDETIVTEVRKAATLRGVSTSDTPAPEPTVQPPVQMPGHPEKPQADRPPHAVTTTNGVQDEPPARTVAVSGTLPAALERLGDDAVTAWKTLRLAGPLPLATLATQTGIPRTSLGRLMKALSEEGWAQCGPWVDAQGNQRDKGWKAKVPAA